MKKYVIYILLICVLLGISMIHVSAEPMVDDPFEKNGFDEVVVDPDNSNNESNTSTYRDCPIFIDASTDPPQPNDFYYMIQDLFNLIKIATPALVIILSLVDYLGAIAKSNDDEVKKANKRTIKRVAIGLAIFFLPFILDIVFEIFGLVDASRCGIGT